MPITFSLAQSATADGNPSVPTLLGTPTAGNLLVLIATERSGTSHAAYTFSDIANWTKVIANDNELGNANVRHNVAVWIKKAGASEATSHSVDNGTANSIRTMLLELAPSEAVNDYVVPAGGSSVAGTGTSTSFTPPLGTGSTSSLAAANYLILCAAGLRNGAAIDQAAPTWDNSPDVQGNSHSTSTNDRLISYGFKDDSSGGAYSANVTWSQSSFDTEASAGIVAIEAQTAGGGGTPSLPPVRHRPNNWPSIVVR